MEVGRSRKLMVAIDDNEKSVYTLEWTLNYLIPAVCDSDHLVILYVASQVPPDLMVKAEEKMIDSLISSNLDCGTAEQVQSTCKKHKITYQLKVMVGEAKLVICEAAKKLSVDLLVVGSHDYGGPKRLFSSSSVGDYCVQHAKCPVVVVKRHGKTH